MHGLGVYSWPDGRKYVGSYIQDKKEGYGEYTWVINLIRMMEGSIEATGRMENKMDQGYM